MLKAYFIILFILLTGCKDRSIPIIISQDYSSLSTVGGTYKYRQSNDTLYEYDCSDKQPCDFKTFSRHKIVEVKKIGIYTLLHLRRFDTIPLNENLCPEKDYSIMALKFIDTNQIGFQLINCCLTRKQFDTIQPNLTRLNESKFSIYYSDNYLKKILGLKSVFKKQDVEEIINSFGDNNFKLRRISYSRKELYEACIDKGFSPLRIGLIVDSVLYK